MPTVSNYLINFTDPLKAAITVTGGQKNGPGFVVQSTSLVLVGQFAPIYGEDINENFLHLLENFSYTSPPVNPVNGQIWNANIPSYNNRVLTAPAPPDTYQGDYNLRSWVKNFNGAEFWALPRIVLIDDNIANRSSMTSLPGDLWLDTAPNSANVLKTGDSRIGVPERNWDFPELKIFDPDTSAFESIGRNYIKINDNGIQIINSSLTVTNDFTVTLNTTLNGTLNVVQDVTLDAKLYVFDDCDFKTDVLIEQSLQVDLNVTVSGVTNLGGNIFITNNSSLVSDGDSTFINSNVIGNFTVTGVSTFNDNVGMTENLVIDKAITIGSVIANQNLTLTGSGYISGDLTITGVGYGRLFVTGNTTLTSVTASSLNVTGAINFGGTLTAQNIDLQNLYQAVNCIDPVYPQDVATKNYIDSNYLRRNDILGSALNEMDAVLTLQNVNQNLLPQNASTVGYVDYKDSFNVKKAGDSINNLTVTTSGVGLIVNGLSQFNNLMTIYSANVITTFASSDLTFSQAMSCTQPNKTFNMNNGYITGVINPISPISTDVVNFGYISSEINDLRGNYPRINPTGTPKNGDLRVDTSPSRVYVYVNTWIQIYPAQYA